MSSQKQEKQAGKKRARDEPKPEQAQKKPKIDLEETDVLQKKKNMLPVADAPALQGSKRENVAGKFANIQAQSSEKQQQFFLHYFNQMLAKELTPLDSDQSIPATAFVPAPQGTTFTLDMLPERIWSAVPAMKSPPVEKGAPLVLVFTRSAQRCLEVSKTLYQLGSQVRVGQFSSKHRKIKDQQEDLVKTTPVHIGAGTPDRLRKLVDDGTLSLNQLCLIGTRQSERVIDLDLDLKGYHVIDLKDTGLPFYRFFLSFLGKKVAEGKVKIMLH